MFHSIALSRQCEGGTWSVVSFLPIRSSRQSILSIALMLLSVVTLEHGPVCVDVSDEDPSVYAVRQVLQRVLQVDIANYDLMLGTYCLTDSMCLADFGLTDGNCDLSLLPRATNSTEVVEDGTVASSDDAIEECSPDIIETDPIEWTQTANDCKRVRKRASQKIYKRHKVAPSRSTDRSLPFLPQWRNADM